MKPLIELTPEEKTRLLAEFDGKWKQKEFEDAYAYTRSFGSTNSFMGYLMEKRLPSYLTSYDAIIPLVQKMDTEIRRCVYRNLWRDRWTNDNSTIAKFSIDVGEFFSYTPSQLCDAVLIATGKATI